MSKTSLTTKVKTQKAEISPVPVGPVAIEGLLAEDGKFYVGVPQIADTFSFDKEQASRSIKALMSKDSRFAKDGFSFIKLKTPLNAKAVNTIPLEQFEILLAKLDRSGNVKAQEFRDSLIGLSLHQLFCDAFGVKFEKDDRQKWLKARMDGKSIRRTLTDAVSDYIVRHPELSENHVRFMYNNVSELVNIAVFGRKAKKIAEDLNADRDAIRDSFTDAEIRWLSQIEEMAMRLIDQQDIEPCEAVKSAKERLLIPVVQRAN